MAFTANSKGSDLIYSSEVPVNYEPIVVLELFTSQGCSSCPPADALLDKVNNEFGESVISLSYHVDYWNYIGWTDPFSKSKYGDKQNDYNVKFKNRSNYTPQLVVNGKEHFVGSSSPKLYAAIKKYSNEETTNLVSIGHVTVGESQVSFEYSIRGNLKNKKIKSVLVLNQRKTQVKRGENKNRQLVNSNIVVAEKYISTEIPEGKSIMAIPEIVDSSEKIGLVLLVENEIYDITGAAKKMVSR